VKRFVTDADYKREIRRLEKKAGGIRVMTGGQVSSESFDPIGGVQLKDSNSTFKTFLRQIGGDTYLTANAFFDGSTWRRVDTAKVSWALILRGSSNYPGGAAQAAELWTAPAGANPIGLFGSGSWSLLSRQVSDLASVITRLSVGEAPVNASDVVRKTELDTHEADGSAHGATSEATAEKIVKRDDSGRAKVADPADDSDIATKKYVDDSAGATTFLNLSDTPDDYTGAASKVVRVKADESGLEFVEASAPGAHHETHEAGGADAIKLDDLAAPDDTSDLDVSTSKHGLCPKAPNDTTKFLRGDGAWGVPAGGGADKIILSEPFDDLDDGDLDGQGSYPHSSSWVKTGDGTATVRERSGADKMVRIYAPAGAVSSGVNSEANNTFKLNPGVRVSWDMKIDDDTGSSGGVLIADSGGTTRASVRFGYSGGLIIRTYNGLASTTIQSAVKDTWYHIDMIYLPQATNGMILVYIDGVYKDIVAATEPVGDIKSVRMYSTSIAAKAVNIDYDNLEVEALLML